MATISSQLSTAVRHLINGDVIGIPTETVYGLAANALDESAVLKIFKIKNRPTFDPLIVHIDDVGKIENYVAEFPERAQQLADSFWPGPLTLVLPKKNIIPDLVTSGLDTVGIRIPSHQMTRKLLESIDFPLAAPSANPFGYISPTGPDHVNDQLGEIIPFILDGGEANVGIESTIIKIDREQAIVLRLGGIPLERIQNTIGPVSVRLNQGSNPTAPGMLDSHYAPARKLLFGQTEEHLRNLKNPDKSGILSFRSVYPQIRSDHQIRLSPSGDLEEAAKHLFKALRRLDQLNIDIILAERFPDEGLGRAINDRLMRAAAQNN